MPSPTSLQQSDPRTARTHVTTSTQASSTTSTTPTSLEALSEKYRDFLSDTYKHRIQLRDGSGGHAWAQGSYGSIRKALEREKYAAVFSYLFAFRPYVDDAKTTELSFEVERDGERYTLSIQPLLRDESTLIPQ